MTAFFISFAVGMVCGWLGLILLVRARYGAK